MISIDNINNCPHCNASWDGGDIFEVLKNTYLDVSETTILEWASFYGWSKENKKRFKKNVIGIEDSSIYDGIHLWKCLNCESTFDRFDGDKK